MKTLIIGGGLSGLAIADRLETSGQDYHLLEARRQFGGRMMTERLDNGYFDMGPAWFWPGQPRIANLIEKLGLKKFDQYSTGELTFEDEVGRVLHGYGFASMKGSLRLEGGFAGLAKSLETRLPDARKHLNAQVKGIKIIDRQCHVTLTDGKVMEADRVVLAMPPRVATGIDFTPDLPARSKEVMANIPTWMAGQAKAVAIYDTPFWRDAGLSGDAMSRRGPMVEIHDASPAEGGPFALFGFIGVPPEIRTDEQALRQAVLAQFVRLFGEQASAPRKIFLKDWAKDTLTATSADAAPQHGHPAYGLPITLQDLWDGHLIFAGTEVAQNYGGYIEGALEAAEAALLQLEKKEPEIQ